MNYIPYLTIWHLLALAFIFYCIGMLVSYLLFGLKYPLRKIVTPPDVGEDVVKSFIVGIQAHDSPHIRTIASIMQKQPKNVQIVIMQVFKLLSDSKI